MTKLKDLPPRSTIFVDANIFTYFLLKDPSYFEISRDFISRIEIGEVPAFINSVIITEAIFNFVKGIVISRFGIKPRKFISFTKKNPEKIGEIDISPAIEIFSIQTLVLANPPKDFFIANLNHAHSQNLLSNDAYHLITMQYIGITNIATNDPDFEGIKDLKVWKP